MEFLVVVFSAILVSALTLFSGFGLGTLLMPVFALFFPIEVAVAATAVYVSLLPVLSDSVVMALIHLPVVFWAFLGIVFMGGSWREADSRIRFIRYNGELVVLGSLVCRSSIISTSPSSSSPS